MVSVSSKVIRSIGNGLIPISKRSSEDVLAFGVSLVLIEADRRSGESDSDGHCGVWIYD